MYAWVIGLNLAATLVVAALSLWGQALPLMVLALPFLLTLGGLRRRQIPSFYYTGLIANAVALMVGVLAVIGLLQDAAGLDSTRRELAVTVAALGYVLTPTLNLLTLRRLLRAAPPARPE